MLFPSPLLFIALGLASAFLAKTRGKNPYLWFFLGTLFGVFGIAFLFFSSKPTTQKAKIKEKLDSNTIDITPKLDPIHQNKFWYYLDGQNKQTGPMSFEALFRTWREGKVSKNTYVWNDNLENWKPLGEFI